MSVFHLEFTIHGRSKKNQHGEPESIVGRAAYRAGAILHDEARNQTFDYSRYDARDTFISAPCGAPAWALDREALWNKVEAGEKRMDSQLALEIQVSLPRELTHGLQKKLIEDFIRPIVLKGMICDCAIHDLADKNGDPQPHAHILVTMRWISPDGNGFGAKDRSLRPAFSAASKVKVDEHNFLMETRERWAFLCNEALKRAGLDIRIYAESRIARIIAAVSREDFTGALALSETPPERMHYKRRHAPEKTPVELHDIKKWDELHQKIQSIIDAVSARQSVSKMCNDLHGLMENMDRRRTYKKPRAPQTLMIGGRKEAP